MATNYRFSVITSKLPLVLQNLVSHGPWYASQHSSAASWHLSTRHMRKELQQGKESDASFGEGLATSYDNSSMIACNTLRSSSHCALLGNTYTAPRLWRYHEPLPLPADQGSTTSRGTTTDTTGQQPTAGFNKDDKGKGEGEDTLF